MILEGWVASGRVGFILTPAFGQTSNPMQYHDAPRILPNCLQIQEIGDWPPAQTFPGQSCSSTRKGAWVVAGSISI